MTKPCECPLAGFCDRHAIEKHEGWHRLCQENGLYREAWDAFRGPGQFNLKAKPLDRIARIKERVARDRRIEGWVRWLRKPGEIGLGDTVSRLKEATKSKEVKAHLDQMLRLQACKPCDAIKALNEKRSYHTLSRPPMDGRLFRMGTPPAIHIATPTNGRAVVVVAPDPRPQLELDITRPLLKAYADRCGADYIEVTEPMHLNHGAANKYVVTQIARHYEQAMMIDTDIVPMPGAANIFEAVPIGQWGMTDELPQIRTCKDATKWMDGEWRGICKALGEHRELTMAWNSGLVVMPRDAELDYFPPPCDIPNTWCAEQHFLTYTLFEKHDRVTELPAVWQAGFPWFDFEQAIKTAHFVHINGTQGVHSTRLAFLRHFATGARTIPETLRNLVRKQSWVTRWAR